MYGEFISTEQLTPSMIRVVLGGGTLEDFEMVPATDAYINARFVPENSTCPFIAQIVWLHRNGHAEPESLLVNGVVASEFPSGTFDVFVHGEAAETRAVRKHLAQDRGVDLEVASISPYWRRRHSDEAWRQVKREWMADQASDLR